MVVEVIRDPNESPMDGTIHPLAVAQLLPFIRAAGNWPVKHLLRDKRRCNVCGKCDQNIWFNSDQAGHPFHYTAEMITDLKVAHIRQAHAEEGL
jgi:hypothetical protein